jgi:adenylate cyclase
MPASHDPDFTTAGGAWLESKGGERWLLRGKCNLGRDAENEIVIDSPKASRKHALLHAQEDGLYWLVDLMSRNGTYRNDHRVVRPTRLRHGDELIIGGKAFSFHQPSIPAPGAESTVSATRTSTAEATVLDLKQQNLWLLIADIENFTSLVQKMDVGELAHHMGRWLRDCHRVVEKGGGRIPKYIGDGFLACWEDDRKAASAAVGIVREFQAMRRASLIRFRVALHFGMVTFGEQIAWGEPTMLGAEMNYIFRLEDLASKLGVGFCVSAAAREKLRGLLTVEGVPGEHTLKGFEGTHRCYRIPDDGQASHPPKPSDSGRS